MNKNMHSWQEQMDEIKELYKNILVIANKQQQLIKAEDELSWPMDTMLEFLNERQAIIQRIDAVDYAGIGTPSAKMALSPGDQAVYSAAKEQIRNTIREIQAIDRSCQAKIESAMEKLSSKMSKNRESKKAQLAYGQGDVHTSAWFFDKKQ